MPRSIICEQARHVAPGAPAVGADDAEPATDEPGDVDGCPHPDRRDADCDDPAAVCEHVECLQKRLLPPQRLEGDVHASVGELEHAGDRILLRGVDRVRRSELAYGRELAGVDVDRDDLLGAVGPGELHDQRPDTAGGNDCDALAGTQIGAVA